MYLQKNDKNYSGLYYYLLKHCTAKATCFSSHTCLIFVKLFRLLYGQNVFFLWYKLCFKKKDLNGIKRQHTQENFMILVCMASSWVLLCLGKSGILMCHHFLFDVCLHFSNSSKIILKSRILVKYQKHQILIGALISSRRFLPQKTRQTAHDSWKKCIY